MEITIDYIQQALVDFEEEDRQRNWDRADLIAAIFDHLRRAGMGTTEAGALIGSCVGRRTHWAQLEEKIATTFPAEYRFPNLSFFIYRVALGAPDPIAAITMANDEALSSKELKAWIDQQVGREEKRTNIRIDGLMDWQGGDIKITPERYNNLDLGEGLQAVPVTAVITTRIHRNGNKKPAS